MPNGRARKAAARLPSRVRELLQGRAADRLADEVSDCSGHWREPGERPMNEQTLKATAAALTTDGKGLLAMDESNPTADKRFAALGIPQTPEMRRAYRD